MKDIFLIDLWKDASKINPYISETLLSKTQENLEKNKKTILYLNKRWEFNLLICQDCHHLYKCPACDITLWVHSHPDMLLCHHCWYSENLALTCKNCHSSHLKKIGVWTQQIHNTLLKLFPEKQIFRLDSDTTSNITQKKETLSHLQNADIIIGTKMITTWFDFANIGLIWVILLEQELQIPKYDTEEKIYSNIKQLIGRWGRKWQQTDIVIQSCIPNNEIITSIIDGNYKDFLQKVLQERKIFWYPPYQEMAAIRYKNKEKEACKKYLNSLFEMLKSFPQDEIEIIKIETLYKRDHQYFGKIILKWNNLRFFLQNIKSEIFKNKDLAVIFE